MLLLQIKMQKTTQIFRLTSTILVCLMLFLNVFGKGLSAIPVLKTVKFEKTSKSEKPQKEVCTVSELSAVTVSSPIILDFSQDFIFLLNTCIFGDFNKQVAKIANLTYRLSYFEVLFEHFIVTNAP